MFTSEVRTIELSVRTNTQDSSLALGGISSSSQNDTANSFTDYSLLRGVPRTTLLKDWRSLLRMPPSDSQYALSHNEARSMYAASHPVSSLDWFISHSWRANGWMKYLALLWFLNRRDAMRYASLVAALWSVSYNFAALPRMQVVAPSVVDAYHVESGFSPIVFALAYFFILFCNPVTSAKNKHRVTFFLDRACIHQSDAELKEAGIRSLGAFLNSSERMLVLWSPDYFSRLWCNYELATFSSLHGVQNIDFVPLFLPIVGIFTILCQVSLYASMYNLTTFRVTVHVCAYVSFWLFGFVRTLRLHSLLRLQIESFAMVSSRCYCCDIDHRLDDGRQIPCDRLFVQANVNRWFSGLTLSDTSCETDGVEGLRFENGVQAFESFVHSSLGKQVCYLSGKFGVPLSNFAHIILLQWFFLFDELFLNSEVDVRKATVQHIVFDALLMVNCICCGSKVMSLAIRSSFLAHDSFANNAILGGLGLLVVAPIAVFITVMIEFCVDDGDWHVVICVAALLSVAAWINFKQMWIQGIDFTAEGYQVIAVSLLGVYHFRRLSSTTSHG